MPAPGRPNAPDHETLVVKREPRADEGETVMKEPVMVPERKPVVEEVVAVVEGEVVAHESSVHRAHMASAQTHSRVTTVHGHVATVHAHVTTVHAHVTTVHAHSAVHRSGTRRCAGADGANDSQSDGQLADHCISPFRKAQANRFPRDSANMLGCSRT
jgi:hypothetical protein